MHLGASIQNFFKVENMLGPGVLHAGKPGSEVTGIVTTVDGAARPAAARGCREKEHGGFTGSPGFTPIPRVFSAPEVYLAS